MNPLDPFGLFGPGFSLKAACEKDEVIAFYGVNAYNQILEAEKHQREQDRLLRRVAPDLIDDVAGQIERG